jgi:hypothetical protein
MERQQFLEIDWHDFTVVETIWFDEPQEEQPPASLPISPLPELPSGIEQLVSEAADAARRAVQEGGLEEEEVRCCFLAFSSGYSTRSTGPI